MRKAVCEMWNVWENEFVRKKMSDIENGWERECARMRLWEKENEWREFGRKRKNEKWMCELENL